MGTKATQTTKRISTAMNDQQKTYVIRHESNGGLQMLIGFVTCMVVLRLWWTGILGDWFAILSQPKDGNLSSATFLLVQFLAEIVSGAGVVLVMVWSGLWWLINDVLSGIREFVNERRAKKELTNSVGAAIISADVQAVQVTPPKPPSDPILDALRTIDKNVRATHAVATEAKNQAINLDGRISGIDARLTAIESTPAPKATTRKPAAR